MKIREMVSTVVIIALMVMIVCTVFEGVKLAEAKERIDEVRDYYAEKAVEDYQAGFRAAYKADCENLESELGQILRDCM